MLYKLYWSQWCQDTQELVSGLAEALAHPHQTSPLAVTFERWFLELKVSHSLPYLVHMFYTYDQGLKLQHLC